MVKAIIQRAMGDRALGRAEYLLRRSLRAGFGGPFNGQVYRRRIFDDLTRRLRFKAIVETGTYRGTTTELFASTGLPVFSAEASPRYHAYSDLRLRRFRNRVRLYQGDSRSFLGALAAAPEVPKANVFFYLDAHWQEDLPLREEVAIIFEHWHRPVVMVDDFEVPGTTYGFDDYGPGAALNMAYLAPLASLGLHAYFPAVGPAEETGRTRGSVVLCADAATVAALDEMTSLARAA